MRRSLRTTSGKPRCCSTNWAYTPSRVTRRLAKRLSIASSILVVALLLVVYRSLPALGLGLLPVTTGALVGVAAVALGFGAVHGITLGFGITLIGESVDYSIYFFVQSQRPPPHQAAGLSWQQAWWPTIRLGMLTSVCGFASLLPSGVSTRAPPITPSLDAWCRRR